MNVQRVVLVSRPLKKLCFTEEELSTGRKKAHQLMNILIN